MLPLAGALWCQAGRSAVTANLHLCACRPAGRPCIAAARGGSPGRGRLSWLLGTHIQSPTGTQGMGSMQSTHARTPAKQGGIVLNRLPVASRNTAAPPVPVPPGERSTGRLVGFRFTRVQRWQAICRHHHMHDTCSLTRHTPHFAWIDEALSRRGGGGGCRRGAREPM